MTSSRAVSLRCNGWRPCSRACWVFKVTVSTWRFRSTDLGATWTEGVTLHDGPRGMWTWRL